MQSAICLGQYTKFTFSLRNGIIYSTNARGTNKQGGKLPQVIGHVRYTCTCTMSCVIIIW